MTTRAEDGRMRIDADVERYAHAVVGLLEALLAGELLAAYLVGSVALGDYVPGQSDVDITAVCARAPTMAQKHAVVDAVTHHARTCPTRGLELVLYPRSAVATPSRAPRFELNLNTGPAMPFHVAFDPACEPAHWFVLDLAIAREHGLAPVGPAAAAMIAPVPRGWLLDALNDSLQWHAEHETVHHNSVLNACRSWRYAEAGVWSSKDDAAAWARTRSKDPAIVDAAVAMRHGDGSRRLDQAAVWAFVGDVRARLERMPR